MSQIKKILAASIAVLMTTAVHASDVYIEQAGDGSTIDITQTGDGNRVGSSTEAATLNGQMDLDVTQVGSSNELDIETAAGQSSGVFNLNFTGDSNTMDMDLGAPSTVVVNTDVTGDSNQIELCGTFGSSITVGQSTAGACGAGTEMGQNDFQADIDIVGDSNKVSIARSGIAGQVAIADVTVNIGSNTASNNNVVNIEQSSVTESGFVSLQMDGSSNVVNIIQQ